MGIRKYKPTSAGRRHGSVLDYVEITKTTPEKSLLKPIKRTGGRNNHGHITARHRGGGHKRMYRVIDFKRNKDGVPAKVHSIEYDPNRTCFIALLHYADGAKSYILAPIGLQVGQTILSGPTAEPDPGNSMKLADIPVGVQIHNVELMPGKGAQLCRSAGCSAQLQAREGAYAVVLLPSGELRRVHVSCRASIGRLGNTDHQNVKLGKAGRKRHLGRRPHVRGTAMNPVDHPMGGGEGRTAGGRHPCSPSGVLAKGGRTRRRNHPTDAFIIRRRKKR
ncbi:MAG: 50S ribosomal protein L2 [Planctomycetes bacterium]|nr:50S ribosomal protein L2 [Planctomycetota bacterium]MCB9910366.1 50S ribosomal protein L2 [Planctomycetota bacterium]MCB9912023.1 50S ribosomal protein L2 [Planctomycetota bacterium]HRV80563.1 50S ribosomal protein L2 [Planctomycetota bacterium]